MMPAVWQLLEALAHAVKVEPAEKMVHQGGLGLQNSATAAPAAKRQGSGEVRCTAGRRAAPSARRGKDYTP
jgi:hypothetical protein